MKAERGGHTGTGTGVCGREDNKRKVVFLNDIA